MCKWICFLGRELISFIRFSLRFRSMLKTTGWEVGRASRSWVIQRISQGPGRKQFTWDGSKGNFKQRTVFGSTGRARWSNRRQRGTKKLATVGNSQPPRTKGLELEEETHKSVSMRAGALELGLGGSRGLEGPLSSEIANQEGVRKEGTLWPLSSHLWLTVVSASPRPLTTKRAWMMWSAGPEWASKHG